VSQSGAKSRVLVLMYHSVANGDGPTFMPRSLYEAQLDALKDAGYHVAPLADIERWRNGEGELPAKTAMLTFDDALSDFAEAAAPAVLSRGWTATVFAPTSWVGRHSGWRGADPRQRVLSWAELRSLRQSGIEIGSHAETHRDLAKLPEEELRAEIANSRIRLEQELDAPVTQFAAPYGAVNAAVRAEIARHYRLAAGVKLGRADRRSDLFDLPRIEMHYFRDLALWRNFLRDGAGAYFALRQVARSVRAGLSRTMVGGSTRRGLAPHAASPG
jgi:peptidoglycan/xylan/chitin deacetylase (PgdA/CDA1 family)